MDFKIFFCNIFLNIWGTYYFLYSFVFSVQLFLANYIDLRKISMGLGRGENCRKDFGGLWTSG